MRVWILIAFGFALIACDQDRDSAAPVYDTAIVEERDIQVNVEAAGVIEPETTIDVKSKASGEILAVHAETGDTVQAGTLLVEVDKRTPRNQLAEAEAALLAARARLRIAETANARSERLRAAGTLTEQDVEQTQLDLANAQAQVVSAEVAVENARIALDDAEVRAPIAGTIITKSVETGTVISSPTQGISDGTALMQMADLSTVQVRTLVDETDIGKIVPGMPATVTVAAYPNQPFEGEVLKIEPQAVVESNVTQFAVIIKLDNPDNLLKPGMNADVEISIASRESVPAVPSAALRADSDVPATAAMLGVDVAAIQVAVLDDAAPVRAGNGGTLSLGGRQIELPAGVDAAEIRELMEKRRSGGELTSDEQRRLRSVMQQAFDGNGGAPGGFGGARPAGPGGGPPGGGPAWWDDDDDEGGRPARGITQYQFGGSYWVVALRDGRPVPVRVETGLTDLGHTEIVSGLELGDEVLLLPSTSLFEQQTQLQDFISQRFSGGTPFSQNGGGRRGPFW